MTAFLTPFWPVFTPLGPRSSAPSPYFSAFLKLHHLLGLEKISVNTKYRLEGAPVCSKKALKIYLKKRDFQCFKKKLL